ncbi:MAG: endonuclease/exonuclease/phosphatase family protein [Geminicoccaceae bacterium]
MAEPVRIAAFNTALSRKQAGELAGDLAGGGDVQAQAVAYVLQSVRPDIVLLSEIDYTPAGEALDLLQSDYLAVPQAAHLDALDYAHSFTAPVNTGLPSGMDLNRDGEIGGPGDAFGFGFHEGQYGMAVLSSLPIDAEAVRTFQTFSWADMPGALRPMLPADNGGAPEPWYDDTTWAALRLSSKSHWDVPISVGSQTLHILAAHPTPPVFDGPEDRNGLRNHDEIRLFADYVTPGAADYLYDDAGGRGGLAEDAAFVILGDMNADPFDGDSSFEAARQFTEHARIGHEPIPSSAGGVEQAARQGGANRTHEGDPAFDTGDFGDRAPGNLRIDYVLPSADLNVVDAGVFWPTSDQADALAAAEAASDHRLVWIDVLIDDAAETRGALSTGALRAALEPTEDRAHESASQAGGSPSSAPLGVLGMADPGCAGAGVDAGSVCAVSSDSVITPASGAPGDGAG